MDFRKMIADFQPECEQEAADQKNILWYADQFPETVLTRENTIAHITSSGLILNPKRDKMLMVYHIIRDCWSWTGGHADGDSDLLGVAVREAVEETGVQMVRPLCNDLVSVDVLAMEGHIKNGVFVSGHLHLEADFLLICDDSEALAEKPDENRGVKWLPLESLDSNLFTSTDRMLYKKLVEKARR